MKTYRSSQRGLSLVLSSMGILMIGSMIVIALSDVGILNVQLYVDSYQTTQAHARAHSGIQEARARVNLKDYFDTIRMMKDGEDNKYDFLKEGCTTQGGTENCLVNVTIHCLANCSSNGNELAGDNQEIEIRSVGKADDTKVTKTITQRMQFNPIVRGSDASLDVLQMGSWPTFPISVIGGDAAIITSENYDNYDNYAGKLLWIESEAGSEHALVFNNTGSAVQIGTLEKPVLIISTNNLRFNQPDDTPLTINGMLVSLNGNLTLTSNNIIINGGYIIKDGNSPEIEDSKVHSNTTIIDNVKKQFGRFEIIEGSYKDFGH